MSNLAYTHNVTSEGLKAYVHVYGWGQEGRIHEWVVLPSWQADTLFGFSF